jgi:hypothetical protein
MLLVCTILPHFSLQFEQWDIISRVVNALDGFRLPAVFCWSAVTYATLELS